MVMETLFKTNFRATLFHVSTADRQYIDMSILYFYHISARLDGLVGRVSALGVEGCGFKPQPDHAKDINN